MRDAASRQPVSQQPERLDLTLREAFRGGCRDVGRRQFRWLDDMNDDRRLSLLALDEGGDGPWTQARGVPEHRARRRLSATRGRDLSAVGTAPVAVAGVKGAHDLVTGEAVTGAAQDGVCCRCAAHEVLLKVDGKYRGGGVEPRGLPQTLMLAGHRLPPKHDNALRIVADVSLRNSPKQRRGRRSGGRRRSTRISPQESNRVASPGFSCLRKEGPMTVADFSLSGRVAIVTGGSRGIGRGIALGLAEAGADVCIAARKPESLQDALEEIRGFGHRAIAVPTNVREMSSLENLIAETKSQLGRIDILVNNAGTNPVFGPTVNIDERAWDAVMNTNLRAVFFLSKLAREAMLEHGQGGSIINIASTGGLRASGGLGIYSVSKAGVVMLTRVLAKE
ncbi:MAG: SDR family NAD(P)-dependent oxidoreductase, partial [Dehalococcoidia bacterium]